MFSRMRILAGGQVLEGMDVHNRVHELFSIFIATESKENDYGNIFVLFPLLLRDATVDLYKVDARF